MEGEISFLRSAMNPPDRTRDRCVAGTIGAKTVTVLRSGVGPKNASRRLAQMTKGCDSQCVLSIGCAGALDPSVKVGDVVISERIVDGTSKNDAYYPSLDLVGKARDCCKKLDIAFHSGTTVSMAEVAANPGAKAALAKKHDALAVDMESAQVAAWAYELGLPILAIRAVSDASTDSIPPEIGAIVDPRGKLRPLTALALFSRRPALLLETVRLKRKLDRSLGILEKIVTALLGEM